MSHSAYIERPSTANPSATSYQQVPFPQASHFILVKPDGQQIVVPRLVFLALQAKRNYTIPIAAPRPGTSSQTSATSTQNRIPAHLSVDTTTLGPRRQTWTGSNNNKDDIATSADIASILSQRSLATLTEASTLDQQRAINPSTTPNFATIDHKKSRDSVITSKSEGVDDMDSLVSANSNHSSNMSNNDSQGRKSKPLPMPPSKLKIPSNGSKEAMNQNNNQLPSPSSATTINQSIVKPEIYLDISNKGKQLRVVNATAKEKSMKKSTDTNQIELKEDGNTLNDSKENHEPSHVFSEVITSRDLASTTMTDVEHEDNTAPEASRSESASPSRISESVMVQAAPEETVPQALPATSVATIQSPTVLQPPSSLPATALYHNGHAANQPTSGIGTRFVRAETAPLPLGQAAVTFNVGEKFISTCSGVKKALLIGINYEGQQGEMQGSVIAAKQMKQFLMRYWRFPESNIYSLTDDHNNTEFLPTRKNIMKALKWLSEGAQSGDSLFFLFVGQGGQTKDLKGEELDGMNSTIKPLDHRVVGDIIDDDLHELMIKPLPPGSRFTALIDCSFSASMLDLPFMYAHDGTLKSDQVMKKEMAVTAAKVGFGLISGNVFGAAMGLGKSFLNQNNKSNQVKRQIQRKMVLADVISFSGSKDDEVTADAILQGKLNSSALTQAFISILLVNPRITYLQLLTQIREYMKAYKFPQKPQISSGRYMNMNEMFLM